MPRWTPFEPYFWSLVKKSAGCWEWLGGVDGHGYGRVWRAGRRQGAHRVAYELMHGQIPDGLYACHHCDNKTCVRPDARNHVFLGTQKDNMQDWTQKGKNRLANDRTLWSNGKHWQNPASRAKLSNTRKEEIASGRRIVVKGAKGRIVGTKMRGNA